MSSEKQNLGKSGQRIAKNFLIRKKYKILTQNWHSRFGEIDIIAIDGMDLIFIEVKTRTNTLMGSGVEAVTKSKIRKMVITAKCFIQKNTIDYEGFRIEVVEVSFHQNKARIRHYRDVQI